MILGILISSAQGEKLKRAVQNGEEVDFFSHLEMHMRTAASPLLGNDHLQFRSKFAPVKDVIDGDLCEMYASLGPEKQRAIAEQLEATVGEVLKRLEARRELIV